MHDDNRTKLYIEGAWVPSTGGRDGACHGSRQSRCSSRRDGASDQRRTERFGGALRIGIGIKTGVVIAGTIGGGSKLELL